jgi:protein-S-isoprenylcysteine O-methyltransferase Ste14
MYQGERGPEPVSERHANVLVRPPNLYLGGLALGCLFELLLPLGPGLAGGKLRPIIIGLGLAAIGVVIIWKAIRQFVDAGTTIPVDEPTDALVTHGLYNWSRNPIYIGLTVIYVGLSIALTTGWALLFLPVVLGVMQKGVIEREEAYLQKKFGAPYEKYKEKVPRWL